MPRLGDSTFVPSSMVDLSDPTALIGSLELETMIHCSVMILILQSMLFMLLEGDGAGVGGVLEHGRSH